MKGLRICMSSHMATCLPTRTNVLYNLNVCCGYMLLSLLLLCVKKPNKFPLILLKRVLLYIAWQTWFSQTIDDTLKVPTYLAAGERTGTDPNRRDLQRLRDGFCHRRRHTLHHHGEGSRLLHGQSVLDDLSRLHRCSPLRTEPPQHAFFF